MARHRSNAADSRLRRGLRTWRGPAALCGAWLIVAAFGVAAYTNHLSMAGPFAALDPFVISSSKQITLQGPVDTFSLKFNQPVHLHDVQRDISATNERGDSLPTLVMPGDADDYRVRVPLRDGENIRISFPRPLASAAGGALKADQVVHVRLIRRPDTTPTAVRIDKADQFFGVNSNHTRAFTPSMAAWIGRLGVGLVRQGWSMQGVNPGCLPLSAADHWNWSAFDDMLETYRRAGAKVLLTALQFSAPACATNGVPDPSALMDEPRRYAEFVEAITRRALVRHRGEVVAIELGNEEDSPNFWKGRGAYTLIRHDAGAYFSFMRPAAEAVKRVRLETGGSVAILNGGYAGSAEDVAWWSSLLSEPGFASLIDGLNVHIYPWAGAGPNQAPGSNSLEMVNREAAAARDAGLGNMPFWISEVGVQSSARCAWSVDEAEQARLLVGLYAYFAHLQRPQVKSVVWFPMQDDASQRQGGAIDSDQPGPCYASQGIGLIDDNGRPRPAFDAYQKLIVASTRR